MNIITVGLLAIVLLFTVSAANAATISLAPPNINVLAGETFTVNVNFTDFPAWFGGGLILDWSGPPAVGVSLTSTQTDIIDQISPHFDLPFADLTVANQLTVSASGLFNDPTFTNGAFLLLNFMADSTSSGILNLGARPLDPFIDLAGAAFDPQPDFVGANITVNAVPIPGAVWLLGSGLLGLVGVVRRRSA